MLPIFMSQVFPSFHFEPCCSYKTQAIRLLQLLPKAKKCSIAKKIFIQMPRFVRDSLENKVCLVSDHFYNQFCCQAWDIRTPFQRKHIGHITQFLLPNHATNKNWLHVVQTLETEKNLKPDSVILYNLPSNPDACWCRKIPCQKWKLKSV